jgi:hypothetical protein
VAAQSVRCQFLATGSQVATSSHNSAIPFKRHDHCSIPHSAPRAARWFCLLGLRRYDSPTTTPSPPAVHRTVSHRASDEHCPRQIYIRLLSWLVSLSLNIVMWPTASVFAVVICATPLARSLVRHNGTPQEIFTTITT